MGPIPFMQVNNDRALATGLTFRPIAETAKEMTANLPERADPNDPGAGLNLDTEAELLARWHSESA